MVTKLQSGILLLSFLGIFTPVAQAQQVSEWKAQHVVIIGLDGWGAYSLEKADMPHVKQLMADGACTLKKRSVLPSSSAVNWASMFMGAGPELHGYTHWDSKKPELPSREISHYGMFPTVFGLLRDACPKAEIGYVYEWDGMKYLVEQQALNFSQEIVNHATQDTTIAVACNYIREAKPNLFALIIDEPDHTGHGIGHDTPEYYDMLHKLDGSIAQVIQAVKDAGMYEATIFILTSDHGGINKGHGGKTMPEMETPFIIFGKNIKQGLVFEESMMQFDVASTIAYIFGLNQPQVWIGRPMTQVFTVD